MGTRPSRHRAAGARFLAACRRPGEAPGFPSSGPIAGGEPTQAQWVSTLRFQFAKCVLKEETGVHGCPWAGGARWHLRFSALHSHLPSRASRAPPWFRPSGLPGGGGGVHFLGALPWSPPPPSSVGAPRHSCARGHRAPSELPGARPAPRGTSSARPLPPLSGDRPRPRAAPVNRPPRARGGAFQCSAAAPSRFVIRQKAADCRDRYFSLKKLRSNLGEPFSMNTFTPERSLFPDST